MTRRARHRRARTLRALGFGVVLVGTAVGLASCNGKFEFGNPPPAMSGGEAGEANEDGHGGMRSFGGFGFGGFGFGGGFARGGSDGTSKICPESCTRAGLTCTGSGQCVECVDNADCKKYPNMSRCGTMGDFRNRCVQCFDADECRDNEVCSPATYSCVPSCSEKNDEQCDALGVSCAWNDFYDYGYCALCEGDQDCPGQDKPHCSEDLSMCVQCNDNKQCDGKICDVILKKCVECQDSSDCKDQKVCERTTHTCI